MLLVGTFFSEKFEYIINACTSMTLKKSCLKISLLFGVLYVGTAVFPHFTPNTIGSYYTHVRLLLHETLWYTPYLKILR